MRKKINDVEKINFSRLDWKFIDYEHFFLSTMNEIRQ